MAARRLVPIGLIPFLYVAAATNVIVLDRAFGFAASFHDQHRILQLVALAAVSVAVVVRRGDLIETWARHSVVTRRLVAGVAILGLVSAMRAPFPRAALREVGLFTLLVITSLLVADVRRRMGTHFDRAASTTLFAGAVAYAASFLLLEYLGSLGFGVRKEAMWGFSNPRFFGQVALWVLPLLVSAATFASQNIRVRVIIGAIAALWGALTLESGSRAALVSLMGAFLVVAGFHHRTAARWLSAAIAVGAGSWFSWRIVFGSREGGGASGISRLADERVVETDRLIFARDSLRLANEQPVLGIGPEHYAHTPDTLYAHPHNALVQLAAEWGYPVAATVAFLALWGALAWFSRRSLVQGGADPNLVAGLSAALTAGAVASLADGIIVMPISQVLLAAVLGWMMGMYPFDGVPAHATAQNRSPTVLAGLVLISATAVTVGALPYALDPAAEVARFEDRSPDQLLAPRFWLVGRFAPADWTRLDLRPAESREPLVDSGRATTGRGP